MTDEEKVNKLIERVNELEKQFAMPKDRIDIAHDVAYELVKTFENIKLVDISDENEGPMGGRSSRVILAVTAGRNNTERYVCLQIYDDERIQQLGKRLDKLNLPERRSFPVD